MWKRAAAATVVTAALVVTVTGNMHFKEKIAAATDHVKEAIQSAAAGSDEQSSSYAAYMKNLPDEAQAKIKQAIETGKPLQLVIAGDEATTGWPAILEKNLNDTYGSHVFDVVVKSYPQKTTQEWVNDKLFEDIVNTKPDILLYEPSLLVDAGVIGKQQSIQNVSTLLDDMKKNIPGVVILVQPPNPLYGAKHYPETIQLLQEMLKSKGITYVNHWTNWPDPNSNEMLQYLEKPDGWANAQGQQLWAQAVTGYFIAK